MVDGAALEKRSAKAAWVRIPPSPPLTHHAPTRRGPPAGSYRPRRRGRLVDYGAALEMRFGATRRGFESRPLRQRRTPVACPPSRADDLPGSTSALEVLSLACSAAPSGSPSTSSAAAGSASSPVPDPHPAPAPTASCCSTTDRVSCYHPARPTGSAPAIRCSHRHRDEPWRASCSGRAAATCSGTSRSRSPGPGRPAR